MRHFLKIVGLALAGMAAGCVTGPAKTAGFGEVRGKEWALTEVISRSGSIVIDRQKPEAGGMADRYTLFIDDERIGGRASPNRYFAPYLLEEGRGISLGAVAGTLMANLTDPGGLQEEAYYRFLEGVYRWDLSGDRLELLTKGPDGTEARLIYREKAQIQQ
ncbi:MAG: META domain-containing protein [Treponema sp.]|jgi:heat shock protein HslJ|nr:META domain-containing protein [Treponema sp.]